MRLIYAVLLGATLGILFNVAYFSDKTPVSNVFKSFFVTPAQVQRAFFNDVK